MFKLDNNSINITGSLLSHIKLTGSKESEIDYDHPPFRPSEDFFTSQKRLSEIDINDKKLLDSLNSTYNDAKRSYINSLIGLEKKYPGSAVILSHV